MSLDLEPREAGEALPSLFFRARKPVGSVQESYELLLKAFHDEWSAGRRPSVKTYWQRLEANGGESRLFLSALIKIDLQMRFNRGEVASAADYLDEFPILVDDRERMMSLVYEEYCLCEEHGRAPTASEFCNRYPHLEDSLHSQLNYHRFLSKASGTAPRCRFPEPGELFAKDFRLHSVLGQGGAARVFLAEQYGVGSRQVALKVSAPRGKEASIQGRLDHGHIVPVWAVAEDEERGLRGLCMPYRAGLPLNEVIARIQPQNHPKSAMRLWDVLQGSSGTENLSLDDSPGWSQFPREGSYYEGVAWFVSKIARGLEHAHERGILHRDVKPANILFTRREGPQLLDFNLAHDPYSADQAEAALSGGTLPYMAPEQLRALLAPDTTQQVTARADIYALGLVLEEMLTGELPRVPSGDLSLPRLVSAMLDLRSIEAPPIRDGHPRIPHSLVSILTKCLAFREADRYASVHELLVDLQMFLTRQPLRTARNTSILERTRNLAWRKRGPLKRACACAGVIALGALLVPVLRPVAQPRASEKPGEAATHQDPALFVALGLKFAHKAEAPNDPDHAEYVIRAKQYFETALEIDPDSYRASMGLAHLINSERNDRAGAIRLYDQALKQIERSGGPNDTLIKAQALIYRAMLLQRLSNELRGADESAEAFILTEPNYQRARSDLDHVDRLETALLALPERREARLLLIQFWRTDYENLVGMQNICMNHEEIPLHVREPHGNTFGERAGLVALTARNRILEFSKEFPEFRQFLSEFQDPAPVLSQN